MIEVAESAVTILQNDAILSSIQGLKFHDTQFPNELEEFPFIVVMDETIDTIGEDAMVHFDRLTVVIMTMSNDNAQLKVIRNAVKEALHGKGFSDDDLKIEYNCFFNRELPMDLSDLKLKPKPKGSSLRFLVSKIDKE